MHWSNLNASQINQTAITVSQSPHGDFFFLFKCSMNIPAHCFHTTCLPRQLVNKYDPFIFHSVRLSARQQQRIVLLSRTKPARLSISLSTVFPPALWFSIALMRFIWRGGMKQGHKHNTNLYQCDPIKPSLTDSTPKQKRWPFMIALCSHFFLQTKNKRAGPELQNNIIFDTFKVKHCWKCLSELWCSLLLS